MKKFITLFTLVFVLITTGAFADKKDKIKFKDYMVTIEGDAYLSASCKSAMHLNGPCTFSNAQGTNKVVVIIPNQYVTKVKKYNSASKTWYYADGVAVYFTLRFVESGEEFYMNTSFKQIIRAMYESNLVSPDGTIEAGKLASFKMENATEKPDDAQH